MNDVNDVNDVNEENHNHNIRSVVDKLYENQRGFVSYHELYTICKEFLGNVKNSQLVETDSLVLCFGTFLEVMSHHPSIPERWLNVMTNTLKELSLNSYRTCYTIYNDSNENNNRLRCLWLECIGCVSVELSEAGMIYKYPIDKKIDYLTEKHFPSSDFQEMGRIYDMMNEYFENHTEQKYTKIYVDSLILGIYISTHAFYVNNQNESNDIKPIKALFVKYVKHILRNERILQENIKFVYGNYYEQ